MAAVPILIVIFCFIGAMSYIGEKEKTKRTKMKLEATLRHEEMSRGYAPGTFSNIGGDEDEEEGKNEDKSSKMSRREMEQGMKDLEKRMEALDALMKNRKNN